MTATVRYIVGDVDRSVAFYTRHLGFTLDQQMGAAFARVSRADLTLWLAGPESSAARPMPDARRPEPGGWNRFVIEVEDIETTVAALRAEGVGFRKVFRGAAMSPSIGARNGRRSYGRTEAPLRARIGRSVVASHAERSNGRRRVPQGIRFGRSIAGLNAGRSTGAGTP